VAILGTVSGYELGLCPRPRVGTADGLRWARMLAVPCPWPGRGAKGLLRAVTMSVDDIAAKEGKHIVDAPLRAT